MAQTSAPEAALASLDEAFDQGDIDRISAELAPLEAAHPGDARVRTFRARLTAAEGDQDQALALLRGVLRDNPAQSAEAEAYLGAILVARDELEAGLKHLTSALERGAEVPAANYAMGVALAAGEQYQEALAFLALAADKMPGSAATFFHAGLCQAQLGEFLKADAAFVMSVRIEPRQVDAWDLLARVRVELGKPEEALEALDEGLKHNPGHPRLMRQRVQLLIDFGRRDLAVKAVEQIPEDARTDEDETTLAIAAMEARKPAEGLRHARRAVELGAENWNAHYVLGLALEGQQPIDYPAVVRAYETAIALGDPDGRAGTRLGFVLGEERPGSDVQKAIAVLEAARPRSGDHPGTLLNLALCYRRAKRLRDVAPLCALILQSPLATPALREQAERLTKLVATESP